jgi:hypothetical protein
MPLVVAASEAIAATAVTIIIYTESLGKYFLFVGS